MAMFRNVNLAPIDTSGFERAGAAYGQMFQNLGNTIASSVEKYSAKQEKQESKDSMRRIIKNLPSEALEQLGVDTTDPKMVDQMASDMVKAPGQTQQLLATISSLTTADTQRNLNMQKGARDALTYQQELMKQEVLGMVRENPNNPELGKYPNKMVQEALVQAKKEQDEAKQRGVSIRSTELGNVKTELDNALSQGTLGDKMAESAAKAISASSQAEVDAATVEQNIRSAQLDVESKKLQNENAKLDKQLAEMKIDKGTPISFNQFQGLQSKLKEMGMDSSINFSVNRDGEIFIQGIQERNEYTPSVIKELDELAELKKQLADDPNNELLQDKVQKLEAILEAKGRTPVLFPSTLPLPPQ